MSDESRCLEEAPVRPPDADTVRLLYEETCRSHDGVTDFRGKLLALLPLATGAGVFVLLDGEVERMPLGPVGIFGFAVALGLFVYELRGVQKCKMLRKQAAILENELRVPRGQGQYRDRHPARLQGLIGAEFAGWIVYGAVLFSWLYLAGVGFNWWQMVPSHLLIVGYAVVLAMVARALVKEARA